MVQCEGHVSANTLACELDFLSKRVSQDGKLNSFEWRHVNVALENGANTPYWHQLSQKKALVVLETWLTINSMEHDTHVIEYHLYLKTDSLTPWSSLLLEKLLDTQLIRNSAFYGTWMFCSMFLRACHWMLSWARWIQSAHTHTHTLYFLTLLQYSYLCLDLPNGLLTTGFQTKNEYEFLSSYMYNMPCTFYVPWSLLIISVKRTNYEALSSNFTYKVCQDITLQVHVNSKGFVTCGRTYFVTYDENCGLNMSWEDGNIIGTHCKLVSF
jgi:hypothetical protein